MLAFVFAGAGSNSTKPGSVSGLGSVGGSGLDPGSPVPCLLPSSPGDASLGLLDVGGTGEEVDMGGWALGGEGNSEGVVIFSVSNLPILSDILSINAIMLLIIKGIGMPDIIKPKDLGIESIL